MCEKGFLLLPFTIKALSMYTACRFAEVKKVFADKQMSKMSYRRMVKQFTAEPSLTLVLPAMKYRIQYFLIGIVFSR